MARRLKRKAGHYGAELPDGWFLDTDDVVVVSNRTWQEIQDLGYQAYFDDLGSTSDPVTEVVSQRDIQQAARYIRDGVPALGSGIVHTGDGDPGPIGPQGDPGEDGSVWYSGNGSPSGALGVVGDWYLDSLDGDFFEKTGTTVWTLRGNLTGPQGETGGQGPQGETGPQGPQGDTIQPQREIYVQETSPALDDAPGPYVWYQTNSSGDIVGIWVEDEVTVSTLEPISEYSQTFSFAVPAQTWTINHGLGRFDLSVMVFNQADDMLTAEVDYPDANTIVVSHYYPTAGYVRVFD